MTHYPYADRVRFLIELATRLHTYGTTAQRLEAALSGVAARLGLRCAPWANPTGLILALSDANQSDLLTGTTHVIRLAPGDVDLNKLCETDAIAERTLSGEMNVSEAIDALHALDRPSRLGEKTLFVAGFGVVSAAVATLFRGTVPDVLASGGIGLVIGWLCLLSAGRPRLFEALELIAGLFATLMAVTIASFFVPLSHKIVVVASLIVLLPGLTLANAVSELTSQQWVSGTARFAGAMAVLLKLAFGSLMASQLALMLHWTPLPYHEADLPGWAEWLALVAAAWGFAVLFKASRRDYLLVMMAAIAAYLVTRFAGAWLSASAAIFVASVVITVAGNLYARGFNRPGALIRVPGIILMVPGSVGFRGISSIFEQEITLGLDTGVQLATILVALVGGMLIGNVLAPARSNL